MCLSVSRREFRRVIGKTQCTLSYCEYRNLFVESTLRKLHGKKFHISAVFTFWFFLAKLQVLVSYFLRFFLSLLMVISLALIYGSFIFPSFNDQRFSLTFNTLTKISFWRDVGGEKYQIKVKVSINSGFSKKYLSSECLPESISLRHLNHQLTIEPLFIQVTALFFNKSKSTF